MLSRRTFIGTGLGALTAGLLARRAQAFGDGRCPDTGGLPYGPAAPVLDVDPLPPSTIVDGVPFSRGWSGDAFYPSSTIPFHSSETEYPNGVPPDPTETVDICIVGGGMSGLSTAYLLRHHRPVILELAPRFGGVAKGERWQGTNYSLGGAYFMTPDQGSFLDSLYRELGVDHEYRLSEGTDPMELGGQLVNNIFNSPQIPQIERDALNAYRAIVLDFANNHYPDIPLLPDVDNSWILELDQRSFKEDVEARLGYAAPPLLASVIQSYFYSSFGAGWEQISAASGWNFVAAEEFGRWVLPGGNSGLVQKFYERLSEHERVPPHCPGHMLRAGCRAVDVRMLPDGMAQVTYKDAQGQFRALRAKRVVMCCSKHICKYILSDPLQADQARLRAMYQIETQAYVVANILLNAPVNVNFYDIFLLGDGRYPSDEIAASVWSRITDVVDGSYASRHERHRSVLTCYWPLAWWRGRGTLYPDDSWSDYAARTAPQVRSILSQLGVAQEAIVQVRLTRWGHAFAKAGVGQIASGMFDTLRSPLNDIIFFVEHDNWALPAVETCLLEAGEFAPRIARGL